MSATSLDLQIRTRMAGFPTCSVYAAARNLDTGAAFSLRAAERVRTASTIKLPILLAAYHLAARNEIRFAEPLVLREEDRVSGSGVLQELTAGISLPMRDVLNLMIVVSDNTATNMVIERISADAVNDYLDTIGLTATRSLRKVRGDGSQLKPATGWSRAGKLAENQRFGLGVSTPAEMLALLEKLERGQIVSPEASKEILAIMKRQQYKDGIGRHTGDWDVASKSGSLDHLRSDVGVVYTPRGRIAMAITVEDIPGVDYSQNNPGLLLLADLALLLAKGLQ